MQTRASTVTAFQLGFTNSAIAAPYALAKLDCGHVSSVQLVLRRGKCCNCGHEMDLQETGTTYCVCGRSSFTILGGWRNPHVESNRVTKIGDVVECDACAREEKQLAWLKSLSSAEIHHARFRYGSYHFYRQDFSSPSGFFLIGSVNPTPAVEALLAASRISPLSPTEPA